MRGTGSMEGHSATMDVFKSFLNCARKNECFVPVNNSTDYFIVGFYTDGEGTEKRASSNGRTTSSGIILPSDTTRRSGYTARPSSAA
jgi:hypothetical protein